VYDRAYWNARVSPLPFAGIGGLTSTRRETIDGTWINLRPFALMDHRSCFLGTTEVISLTEPESESEGIEWWTKLTERGGEGMVVKPLDFIARGRRSLAQPAVKCRGPEYLRSSTVRVHSSPHNLDRLRSRGLSVKRSRPLRESRLVFRHWRDSSVVNQSDGSTNVSLQILALESELV